MRRVETGGGLVVVRCYVRAAFGGERGGERGLSWENCAVLISPSCCYTNESSCRRRMQGVFAVEP